jgi:hypothetical protein
MKYLFLLSIILWFGGCENKICKKDINQIEKEFNKTYEKLEKLNLHNSLTKPNNVPKKLLKRYELLKECLIKKGKIERIR